MLILIMPPPILRVGALSMLPAVSCTAYPPLLAIYISIYICIYISIYEFFFYILIIPPLMFLSAGSGCLPRLWLPTSLLAQRRFVARPKHTRRQHTFRRHGWRKGHAGRAAGRQRGRRQCRRRRHGWWRWRKQHRRRARSPHQRRKQQRGRQHRCPEQRRWRRRRWLWRWLRGWRRRQCRRWRRWTGLRLAQERVRMHEYRRGCRGKYRRGCRGKYRRGYRGKYRRRCVDLAWRVDG